MFVYVYHDSDHGNIEVYATLQAAKDRADDSWPGQAGKPWVHEVEDEWFREPYQHIHKRKVEVK